jgi:peptidylprolyl isomerase
MRHEAHGFSRGHRLVYRRRAVLVPLEQKAGEDMPVKNGDTVKVHYRGTLADGDQFDSSEGREPIAFLVGAGQVIPGFENAVAGLEVGDKVTLTIPADEAYGPLHEELRHTVSMSDFSSEPFVGGMVTLVSPEGEELQGRVVGIEGDTVSLDFNHPLAGEDLTFDIEVVAIEPKGEAGE